ncbi:hypothetical protein ACFV9E_00240 [Streptomyces sp. NPDC059835]|uniref:hypothetical protein n=1 Tax=Streptomyces sp. NPDC059835 TaxID=3346967 RepID=UPI00364B1667
MDDPVVQVHDGAVHLETSGSRTPEQARHLAERLLRAADEAESGVSEEARLRLELDAVNDALREAGIDYPLGAKGVRDLAALLEMAREEVEEAHPGTYVRKRPGPEGEMGPQEQAAAVWDALDARGLDVVSVDGAEVSPTDESIARLVNPEDEKE